MTNSTLMQTARLAPPRLTIADGTVEAQLFYSTSNRP